ncbi:MAG: class I SAM-dependent methyltransferase [Myxococcales bacterium]|nr:class I SAM-dependent methyltransferase [Myxococcales bacterium]
MTKPTSSAEADFNHLVAPVVAHYERSLARHGPTAEGMDWKDSESQALRFEVLAGVCPLEGRNVLEVGCGAGHLFDHLRARHPGVAYAGVDISAAMIEAARTRHPEATFHCADLLGGDSLEPADVVMSSGVFHVKLDVGDAEWAEYVRKSLDRLYAHCTVALAFNLMSDRVDYRNEKLHHANSDDVVAYCRSELSPFVTLRQDYPLYEFTVYVHRHAPR